DMHTARRGARTGERVVEEDGAGAAPIDERDLPDEVAEESGTAERLEVRGSGDDSDARGAEVGGSDVRRPVERDVGDLDPVGRRADRLVDARAESAAAVAEPPRGETRVRAQYHV